MSTERINAIPTTATSVAGDDFAVIDGATNGTRKILASSLGGGGGGGAAASGLLALTNASQIQWTLTFGVTLGTVPRAIRLSFTKPSTSANNLGGTCTVLTTSNAVLCLDGPAGTTSHTVFWEAIL